MEPCEIYFYSFQNSKRFFFFCQMSFSCFSFLPHFFPLYLFPPLCYVSMDVRPEVLQHITHCMRLHVTGKPFVGCFFFMDFVILPSSCLVLLALFGRQRQRECWRRGVHAVPCGRDPAQYSKRDSGRTTANSAAHSRSRF